MQTTTTTKWHRNNNKNKNKKIHVNWSFCCYSTCCSCSCYCVILLLFICNCECTMRDEQQQQNDTVTKTYTKKMNWDTFAQMYPLANWMQYYRALLHHISLTCTRMQTYPGQMYTPCSWTQCHRAYYTMPVWYVATDIQVRCNTTPRWVLLQNPTHHVSLTCGRMQTYPGQMYTSHWLTLVLQSPTTLCQFDMWKNADIPRSDATPPPPNQP